MIQQKKNTSSQFSYWMYFICHNRFVLLVLSCTLLNPATCFLGWVKSFKIRKAAETGNGGAQVFRKFNSVLNVRFFLKSRMVCGILLLLPCDGCRYKVGISQTKWSVLIGKWCIVLRNVTVMTFMWKFNSVFCCCLALLYSFPFCRASYLYVLTVFLII